MPNTDEESITHYFYLGANYGFSENLIFGLNFPLQKINSEKTDENTRFSALGDVFLYGTYKLWQSAIEPLTVLSISGGLTVPTGSIEKLNLAGNRVPDRLQPGTGTWVPTLGFEGFVRPLTRLSLYGNINGRLPLNENRYDYKPGPELNYSLGGSYNLIPWLDLTAKVEGLHQRKSQVGGQTDSTTESTGGSFLYLVPGVQVSPLETFFIRGSVRFLTYKNVHGEQLLSNWGLLFSVGYRLGL